jgi:predicted membrane protein
MDDTANPRRRRSRIWAGLFLLLVGGVLLLYQMGFPMPDWIFNWHMFLIGLGIFIGFRHNFRGGAWIILILVGGAYTMQDFYPDVHLHRYLFPAVLIIIGITIVLNPSRSRWRHEWREEWGTGGRRWGNKYATGFSTSREGYTSEDFIDTTAIFGGVHKKIVSKTFRGGDITTVMGGTELDLTQADFTGTIRLDVTQIMGGTKIIVPAHWEVRSEVTALFAGFEDKRQQPTISNPEKVLIIDGTSIFGGIELKNF